MRLVIDYLPRAYADGTDIEAPCAVDGAAAMAGGLLSQKGLGCDPRH